MKKLIFMILLGCSVGLSAQNVADKARQDKAVQSPEARYAASTPSALRNDKTFVADMRAVIARADASALYVVDKYATFAYVVGLKDCIEKALAAMSAALKKTEEGLRVQSLCYSIREMNVGDRVPDFTLPTPNGKEVNFYSFLKGKKCVILDFWASWCVWCRKESPNVRKVFDTYKAKGVDVISVSFDTNRDQWVKAIAEDDTPWTQVSDLKSTDEGYLYKWYGLQGIPAIFLIDAQGRIIAKGMRGAAIEENVKKFLNK